MSREQVTGTLHVLRHRKPRSRDWFADFIAMSLEESGRIERRYWPATGYILNDRVDAHGRHFMYRFRRFPKWLDVEDAGKTLTVTATFEPWDNGLGVHLSRPQLVAIEAAGEPNGPGAEE
jgi:hypothetical protein